MKYTKFKKLTSILVSAIAISIVTTGCSTDFFKDSKSYKEAQKCIKYDDYEEACSILETIPDYKDSYELLKQTKYKLAESKLNNGEYDEASELYKSLGIYENAETQVKECLYQKGLKFYSDGNYDSAAKVFKQLPGYKEATYYLDETNKKIDESKANNDAIKRAEQMVEEAKQAADNAAASANAAANANNVQSQNAHQSFYGVWCMATKKQSSAENEANLLRNKGFNADVFVSTDWSNLNPEKWYVVSAGVYSSRADATNVLPSVKEICPDAYVKYSGEWQG